MYSAPTQLSHRSAIYGSLPIYFNHVRNRSGYESAERYFFSLINFVREIETSLKQISVAYRIFSAGKRYQITDRFILRQLGTRPGIQHAL